MGLSVPLSCLNLMPDSMQSDQYSHIIVVFERSG